MVLQQWLNPESEDENSTRSGEDVVVGSPYGKSGAHLGEGSLQSEQLNETESVDEGDFDIRRTGSTVQFMNDQSESFSMNSKRKNKLISKSPRHTKVRQPQEAG